MKNPTKIFIIVFAILLFIACQPSIHEQLEECLNKCDKQFARVQLEYSQCDDKALNDFEEALKVCGQYDKVEVFENCMNSALAKYKQQREDCAEAWKQGQEEYASCKNICWRDIVGTKSTTD